MNFKIFYFLLILTSYVFANNIEKSQPEIIFEINTLKNSQENLEIQVKFNKAVLELKNDNFIDAIKLFKETSTVLEAPSNLNIAVSYYKLNDKKNAIKYFNKVYQDKTNVANQTYSFLIACYYLYEITKNKEYILDLAKVFKHSEKIAQENDLITSIKDIVLKELSNKYFEVKDYKNSLAALNAMSYSLYFKKAMLLIKLKEYEEASKILTNLKNSKDKVNDYNKVLWISTYTELKLNNIAGVKSNLDKIEENILNFRENIDLPLEIVFNKNPYNVKNYFNFVTKFDKKRQLDFIYYFAPFIFSDTEEIIYDLIKGFIYADKSNINTLTNMVKYNAKFLNIINQDPIKRIQDLNNILNNNINNKSYMLYNLGLSYAQVNDIDSAIKYFEKAHKLSPGNKLYAVMYLVSSNEAKHDLSIFEKEFLIKSIQSNNGLYSYYAKEIYNLFMQTSEHIPLKQDSQHKNTIFYKAIDFLKRMQNNEYLYNHILLKDYDKDPLIYLINLVQKKPNENNFKYFSRIQKNIPLIYNNNFLEGPFIINDYYISVLKSLGLFSKADFNIDGNENPTYMLSSTMKFLYESEPKKAIENLNILKEKYNYENRHTMYLNIGAYLEAKRYYDASIQISLIRTLYNDPQTNILIAIQLIQALDINSAKQFLLNEYNNHYIDFKIVGFDDLLLSL